MNLDIRTEGKYYKPPSRHAERACPIQILRQNAEATMSGDEDRQSRKRLCLVYVIFTFVIVLNADDFSHSLLYRVR